MQNKYHGFILNRTAEFFFCAFVSMLLLALSNTASAGPLQTSGQLVHDPALGITFMRNANVAPSIGFAQEFGSGGGMVSRDAIRLIHELNNRRYLGVSKWRLPALAELQHLYAVDGIRFNYRNPALAGPFSNLRAYYWAGNSKSFSFINGQEISFAAYRFVLPVFTGAPPVYNRYDLIRRLPKTQPRLPAYQGPVPLYPRP